MTGAFRSILDLERVIEAPKHRRHHLRQVFRDQAGTRLARGLAMHPDPDRGGLERRTPCASRPAIIPDSTSPAPAVASHGGALAAMVARPSGDGHHRVRSLEQHDGAAAFGGCPHPFEFRAKWMFVADVAEQAGKFSLMRGQNDLRIV